MDRCAILSNCHVAVSAGGLSKGPKEWLCLSGTQVSGVTFNRSFVEREGLLIFVGESTIS